MSDICPKCAVESSELAKFCKGCGFDLRTLGVAVSTLAATPMHPVGLACVHCGALNRREAKFCKDCGRPLLSIATQDPVGPPRLLSIPPVSPLPPMAVPPVQVPPFTPVSALPRATPKPTRTPEPSTSPPEPQPRTRPAYLLWHGLTAVCMLVAGAAFRLGGRPAFAAVPRANAPTAPVTPLPKITFTPVDPGAGTVMAAPAPVAQPASPEQACGSRVFVALSMCMSRQRATPLFASHPQCVQGRKQEEDRQQNENLL